MLAAQALTIANVDRAFSSALTLKKKKKLPNRKKTFLYFRDITNWRSLQNNKRQVSTNLHTYE